ncbi:hypothetical protein C8R45DRAFT_1091703 [Mycena sanguinolenta]|nr:hypothetical protein C8R45DRAFT_1091703 [Mycena sanguinolenta]
MPPSRVRSYIARLAAFKSTMLITLAFLVPQLVFVSIFFLAPGLRCASTFAAATWRAAFILEKEWMGKQRRTRYPLLTRGLLALVGLAFRLCCDVMIISLVWVLFGI